MNASPIVLFLDDCPQRTKKFRSRYPYAKCATTASGIIDLIKAEAEIDALFLDHDLGGRQMVSSDEEDCGMRVVDFLVASDPKIKVRRITVHSLNRPAGKEMVFRLHDAGYRRVGYTPFINLSL